MALREMLREISPSWLQDGEGERLLYTFGLAADLQLERALQGGLLRVPTRCDPSALELIGADRNMPRGMTEGDDSYRVRLQRSIEDWQLYGGTAWGVLRECLHALLDNWAPAMRQVANRYDRSTNPATVVSTKWDSYDAGADGTAQPDHVVVADGNFDWDSASAVMGSWSWTRIWIVLYAEGSAQDFVHPETWALGDPDLPLLGDDALGCLGFAEAADVIERLLSGILAWKARNTELVGMLVSFDGALFDPGGSSTPDGTWGRWSAMSGTDQVLARVEDDVRWCARIEP